MGAGRQALGVPFELFPPLRLGTQQALPIDVLHRLLAGVPVRRFTGWRNALLLAALEYRVADCLLTDFELSPSPFQPYRARWIPSRKTERVASDQIIWLGLHDPGNLRPLPATRALLEQLPQGFVRTALTWAPPVVEPDRPGQPVQVHSNHLMAFLSHWFRVGEVPIRRLEHRTAVQRTLPEVAQGVAYALGPLWQSSRVELPRFNLAGLLCEPEARQVARLLSGYSRAQFFRIRRGVDP